MKTPGHLRIEQVTLPPGQEWKDNTDAWRFVRVSSGAAYWLGPAQPRSFTEGELVVAAPLIHATVRASLLSEVVLQGFVFAPDLLCGFLTLAERHFFESGAARLREPVQFLPSTHPLTRRFAELAARPSLASDLPRRAEVLGLAAAFFADGLSRHPLPAARGLSAQRRFQQIISQMPDIEIIRHSPDQLAALCGCSPRHFNRLFRAHFGESPRARQTELRLLKARDLLADSGVKVIQVALDSGYRSLSLFNALFKRRFGVSPSSWRRKIARAAARTGCLLALASGLLLRVAPAAPPPPAPAGPPAFAPLPGTPTANTEAWRKAEAALRRALSESATPGQTNNPAPAGAATNAPPAAAPDTNGPVFEVKGYELLGNTLLPPPVTDPIFNRHTGANVSFAGIRQALADLQMAYRDRGYVTVSVGLPPQKLTNGIVKVQVTEGRLVQVNVLGNRHFSSNNIMSELPSLRTNSLLNALAFQQDLDRANANRDRQIYPVLSPGPDPGTSVLDLKVKDRLPLHGRLSLDNYSTPNTPPLRANLAASYANLWQLNHQLGLQYSFSPEAYKDGSYNFYDQPLIANYSAYYRMPLAGVNGPAHDRDLSPADFGYDEAARRFRPPAPSGATELLFYASRGFSDTGLLLQSSEVNPPVIPDTGGLQYTRRLSTRTLNPNEDLGARLSRPLPPLWGINSSLSAGLDFKNYRSTLVQDEFFQGVLFIPQFGTTGPPFIELPGPPNDTSQTVFNSIHYLPFSIAWQASAPSRSGVTSFNLNQSFNFAGILSGRKQFEAVSGSTNASGTYYIVSAGLTREQKIVGDWGLRLHADGQWASEPLVSNEQLGLGGQAGPRGYHDGQEYGDTGWRLQLEPHSPYWNMGLAFNKAPIITRTYAFVDYGERYLLDPGARPASLSLLGVGGGVDVSIGEHFDFHVTLGVPLLSTPAQESGHPRVTFSLATQW